MRLLGKLLTVVAISLGNAAEGVEAQGAVKREAAALILEPMFRIESDDSVLIDPSHLVASDSLIHYMDEQSLWALTYAGRVLWRRGREGSGPGEHRQISSLAVEHTSGDVWQLDRRNGRIQIWSRSGQFRQAIPLAIPAVVRVTPVKGGQSAIGLSGYGKTFLQVINVADPSKVTGFPPPISEYSNASFAFAADGWLLGCPAGQIVVTYSYSSRIIIYPSLDQAPLVRQAIDSLPAPEVIEVPFTEGGRKLTGKRRAPTARGASLSSACDSERLYLRYTGRSGTPGRTVDVYQLRDAGYVGSFLLPKSVVSIAINKDRLVAFSREPVPTLLAWRMRWK